MEEIRQTKVGSRECEIIYLHGGGIAEVVTDVWLMLWKDGRFG